MSPPTLHLAPRAELARFVRGLQFVTRAPGAAPYVGLPDGEVDLVVRLTGTESDVHVVGTRMRVLRKSAADLPRTLAVRFKAGGAYPFFGVPMFELTDRIVRLDALWGADAARLSELLAEARSERERLHVVEEALAARLRSGAVFEPASAFAVRRAIRDMTTSAEVPRVDALARTLGVSARQLRRGFDDVVGVGPKAFARLVRFQRAVRAAERAGNPEWAAIASAVGYYDQAHLIAEFRALAGVTPTALTRARPLRIEVAQG